MPVSEISDSNGSVIVASVRQKESQTSFADILNKAAKAENKGPSGSGGIESTDQHRPGETTGGAGGVKSTFFRKNCKS